MTGQKKVTRISIKSSKIRKKKRNQFKGFKFNVMKLLKKGQITQIESRMSYKRINDANSLLGQYVYSITKPKSIR